MLAATEKSITRDGWFKSGDLATIDEEGFVYIKDRGKLLLLVLSSWFSNGRYVLQSKT